MKSIQYKIFKEGNAYTGTVRTFNCGTNCWNEWMSIENFTMEFACSNPTRESLLEAIKKEVEWHPPHELLEEGEL